MIFKSRVVHKELGNSEKAETFMSRVAKKGDGYCSPGPDGCHGGRCAGSHSRRSHTLPGRQPCGAPPHFCSCADSLLCLAFGWTGSPVEFLIQLFLSRHTSGGFKESPVQILKFLDKGQSNRRSNLFRDIQKSFIPNCSQKLIDFRNVHWSPSQYRCL